MNWNPLSLSNPEPDFSGKMRDEDDHNAHKGNCVDLLAW